jgi:hypothetical protein
MLKVFTTVVSILAAATTIDATPTKRAVLIGEDLPWQIYNLSINALPLNMTKTNQTQHITFVAIDNNFDSGLNFTTICTKTAPAGQSIFSTGSYTSCNFTDAGFSLRQDGTFFFRRRYKNGLVRCKVKLLSAYTNQTI